MFNNTDVCICLRNKMACSSLGFVKSIKVSTRQFQLMELVFKKERWTLWTQDWLSTHAYFPKCLAQNLSCCPFLFQNTITNQRENSLWECSSAGFSVVSKGQTLLCPPIKKGGDWHSGEAVSSQAATVWQIHLNELLSHILSCKFHYLMCAWILFPLQLRFRGTRKPNSPPE